MAPALPGCSSCGLAVAGEKPAGVGRQYPEVETSAAEAAREHGITVAETEQWHERLQLGAEKASLSAHPIATSCPV